MIRFLVWLFQVEKLARRLDRRPSPIGRALPPLHANNLALHIHAAAKDPEPIAPSPFL
jgi:hypothetical protein